LKQWYGQPQVCGCSIERWILNEEEMSSTHSLIYYNPVGKMKKEKRLKSQKKIY